MGKKSSNMQKSLPLLGKSDSTKKYFSSNKVVISVSSIISGFFILFGILQLAWAIEIKKYAKCGNNCKKKCSNAGFVFNGILMLFFGVLLGGLILWSNFI